MYNLFKIFVYFVICIATLRNCAPLPIHGSGDTANSTISISKEVEKVSYPSSVFLDSIHMVPD